MLLVTTITKQIDILRRKVNDQTKTMYHKTNCVNPALKTKHDTSAFIVYIAKTPPMTQKSFKIRQSLTNKLEYFNNDHKQ